MKFMLSNVILLVLIIKAKSDDDSGWSLIGNPLIAVRPCNGSTDISASFEPGISPDRENSYSVSIYKNFPISTIIRLELDSDAKISLSDKSFARIGTYMNVFEIRFFREHKYIDFVVQGVTPGVVPYFKSVNINSKEYCNEPLTGFLDKYIEGYKDHAESPSRVLEGNCGRRKVVHTELIVNGASTKAGDWPWHVALYKVDRSQIKYICGGTLISNYIVLTAAHCASIRGVQLLPEVLSAILGKFNLIGGDVGIQEREVHQIVLHDQFNHRHLDYDIALLKLKSEVVFTDYVQPACLWNADVNEKLSPNEIFGTIVGWGFDNTDNLSPQLKQTRIPIVSENTCLKSNPLFYSLVLNENKFCAGMKNGASACNGDSGSAFQIFVPDQTNAHGTKAGAWYVRGIVSMTVARTDAPICDPNHYVVFTDVAKYILWIQNYLSKDL